MEQIIRVKYIKVGPIRYISHLNLGQLFTRALRRANIPVAISLGFNPRFRISFGPPLALGISSLSEYLDIRLKEKMEVKKIIGRLNKALPLGLKIVKVKKISSSADSLVKIIDKAFYIISLKLNSKEEISEKKTQENIAKYLVLKEIWIEKQGKRGIKKVNIRPSISNISIKDIKPKILKVKLELNIGQNGNLNPRYVIKTWLSHSKNNFDTKKIYRSGLCIEDKEVIET